MVFEGLVIHCIPYKERDLIVKTLLRNGLVGSFYIYGGQGGGKHHKPQVFEPGSMMKINIRDQRTHHTEGSDLMVVSEHQKVWQSQTTRHNVHAFYLTCLFFEVIQKFALPYKLGTSDDENSDQAGVFSVLSNALFYVDDSLTKNQFLPEQHLSLFMIKLLHHLGIMPDTESCSYCGTSFEEASGATFMAANGQFACSQCVTGENEKGFLMRMRKGYLTRYQEYSEFIGSSFQEGDKLLQYFCHQFHLKPLELKSYNVLFKLR